MITQKSIVYGAWTVLTGAGEFATAWLDEDGDGEVGLVDVRIVHSDSGEPELSEATKGKRVWKSNGNTDILLLSPDNVSDIYYSTCIDSGAAALLSVDAE